MTMNRAMMLKVEPTLLKLAIHRVGMLEIIPWMIMMNVVSKKIW